MWTKTPSLALTVEPHPVERRCILVTTNACQRAFAPLLQRLVRVAVIVDGFSILSFRENLATPIPSAACVLNVVGVVRTIPVLCFVYYHPSLL